MRHASQVATHQESRWPFATAAATSSDATPGLSWCIHTDSGSHHAQINRCRWCYTPVSSPWCSDSDMAGLGFGIVAFAASASWPYFAILVAFEQPSFGPLLQSVASHFYTCYRWTPVGSPAIVLDIRTALGPSTAAPLVYLAVLAFWVR